MIFFTTTPKKFDLQTTTRTKHPVAYKYNFQTKQYETPIWKTTTPEQYKEQQEQQYMQAPPETFTYDLKALQLSEEQQIIKWAKGNNNDNQ